MLKGIAIVLTTLIAAALAAYAQYLFKKNVPSFSISVQEIFKLTRNRRLMMGFVLYALSLLIYLVALSSGELSFVYPIFSSTFIFVFLISGFVLKEKINKVRIAGLVLIILGIIIISLTY